ncbi:MAG: hypothetical protein KF838_00325 [Phycisphaeraceae bacterium]|nr:MAG: hypothetical protein KF838_00325 [Phycisphaeraceae bacterium]
MNSGIWLGLAGVAALWIAGGVAVVLRKKQKERDRATILRIVQDMDSRNDGPSAPRDDTSPL